jgi:hypothetical protein
MQDIKDQSLNSYTLLYGSVLKMILHFFSSSLTPGSA